MGRGGMAAALVRHISYVFHAQPSAAAADFHARLGCRWTASQRTIAAERRSPEDRHSECKERLSNDNNGEVFE